MIPVITQSPGGFASSATVTCAMNEKSLTPSECMLSFTEYISLVQDYGFRWIAVGYRVTPM